MGNIYGHRKSIFSGGEQLNFYWFILPQGISISCKAAQRAEEEVRPVEEGVGPVEEGVGAVEEGVGPGEEGVRPVEEGVRPVEEKSDQ